MSFYILSGGFFWLFILTRNEDKVRLLYSIQGDSIKVVKTETTKISFSHLFSFCCFDFMAWWIWENIWSVNGLSKALRGVDSADKIVYRFLKGGHDLSLTVYVFVHNLLLKVVYSSCPVPHPRLRLCTQSPSESCIFNHHPYPPPPPRPPPPAPPTPDAHTHTKWSIVFFFFFFFFFVLFFFTLRIAPFSERSKSNFDRVVPL